MLHLAEAEVLYQSVNPALGVPAPCEGAGLPHEGVEEYGLPDAHVRGEVDVSVHQGDSVRPTVGGHTATVTRLVYSNCYADSLYLFPLMRMSPLSLEPIPPCLLAIMLQRELPSSPVMS